MKEKGEANGRKEQRSDSKILIREWGLKDFAVHLSRVFCNQSKKPVWFLSQVYS